MEVRKNRSLVLAVGMALATITTFSYAGEDANFIIKEASDSAHANFFIDQVDMPINVMTEFGYFRTSTKGDVGSIPIFNPDMPDSTMPGPDMPGPFLPFMPGDSEHAYLILHVMPLMLPPFPHPMPLPDPTPLPDPAMEPMPPQDPIAVDEGMMDSTMSDTNDVVLMDPDMPPPPMDADMPAPTEPPMPPHLPPQHEVLYFELEPDQIKITEETTTVEVDSCLQPNPSMFFGDCGLISVSWENNEMHSGEDNIKSVSKTMNGFFGQPMTVKRKHKLKYSSASATVSFMGNMLSNDHAGRSSSKSTQKFFFGNNDD